MDGCQIVTPSWDVSTPNRIFRLDVYLTAKEIAADGFLPLLSFKKKKDRLKVIVLEPILKEAESDVSDETDSSDDESHEDASSTERAISLEEKKVESFNADLTWFEIYWWKIHRT